MKKLLLNGLLFTASIFLANCSDDDDQFQLEKPFINPAAAKIYVGTQSPGDVWSWTLDKEQGHMTATWDYGTFEDKTDDIYIEGTFVTLPSGFMKVTIIKAVPPNPEIPTDGTAWFYAIEIPDMAMVIKPEGSIKGDVIAMVPQGDCASIPGTYNYIITAPGEGSSYDPITQEAFGYIEMTASGSDYKIEGFKFSLDCVDGGNCTDTGVINGIPLAACSGSGDVVISDGGKTIAQGQFTDAGAMMMDFGYGNGGIFALKASENANKGSLKNNTYNGIAYLPKKAEDKTMPVQLKFIENELGAMIGTGHPYKNLETATVSEEEGVVIVVNNVINGRVLGTTNFNEDNTVSEMAAALLVNGNDQILIMISYDEALDPFILILAKD